MNFIKRLRYKYGKKIKLMNREGEVVYLPGSITIEDLVRLGFSKPYLGKPGVPLKQGEWESIPEKRRRNRVLIRDPSFNATPGGTEVRRSAEGIVETKRAE